MARAGFSSSRLTRTRRATSEKATLSCSIARSASSEIKSSCPPVTNSSAAMCHHKSHQDPMAVSALVSLTPAPAKLHSFSAQKSEHKPAQLPFHIRPLKLAVGNHHSREN